MTKAVAVPAEPQRSPHEFATRDCVLCGAELRHETSFCTACHRHSQVRLCEHGAARPAWRVTRWHAAPPDGGRRRRDLVAVAVGDVTVFLGRSRDALELRAENGVRLPLRQVKAVEPGTEIIERMTHVGSCYRCRAAFFLADCEITQQGAPRILRVPIAAPTRQYLSPFPEPAKMAAAYLELGQPREEDEP